MILASGLDAFVFAREKLPGRADAAPSGFVAPLIAPVGDGVIAGAQGTF